MLQTSHWKCQKFERNTEQHSNNDSRSVYFFFFFPFFPFLPFPFPFPLPFFLPVEYGPSCLRTMTPRHQACICGGPGGRGGGGGEGRDLIPADCHDYSRNGTKHVTGNTCMHWNSGTARTRNLQTVKKLLIDVFLFLYVM